MISVLDELQLTALVTSITGLSPVGAAAILAETGDLTRFATARGPGQTRRPGAAGEAVRRLHRPHQTHRPGTPRTAGGRVACGMGSPTRQPVYAARYRHLTSREQNQLTPTQAQTVIAAAILRHLHAVITTGRARDPSVATHGTQPRLNTPIAA
jgi:transposase